MNLTPLRPIGEPFALVLGEMGSLVQNDTVGELEPRVEKQLADGFAGTPRVVLRHERDWRRKIQGSRSSIAGIAGPRPCRCRYGCNRAQRAGPFPRSGSTLKPSPTKAVSSASVFSSPGRAHCFDVERKRQPPPDAALVVVGERLLVQELGGNAPLHAEGLDEIMHVEAFGVGLVAAIIAPASRIEDPNDVRRVRRLERFHAAVDVTGQL